MNFFKAFRYESGDELYINSDNVDYIEAFNKYFSVKMKSGYIIKCLISDKTIDKLIITK